jgi:hypothetical protein
MISLGLDDDRHSMESFNRYEGPIPAVGDHVFVWEWPSRMKDRECDIPPGETKDMYELVVRERRYSWIGRDINSNPKTSSVELCCELYESKG